MTSILNLDQLRRSVETAQLIVADVSDPDLRAIAFGRVLEHLLIGGGPVPEKKSAPISASQVQLPAASTKKLRDGPMAWVDGLVRDGFFSGSKSLADVTEAVRARGHNIESKNVTDPLERLVRSKVLRREREAGEGLKRGVWRYSTY